MFPDNALSFSTSWSTAQAITTTADSTLVIDVTGAGSGNVPTMIGGGANGTTAGIIGADYGAADGEAIPWCYITVTTSTTSTNTITFELESSPANTSNTAAGYQIIFQSQAYAISLLPAGTTFLFPVPPSPQFPSGALTPPRFYKLHYVASGTVSLSVLAGLVLNPPTWQYGVQIPNNFLAV
jgi:hypothetical protein